MSGELTALRPWVLKTLKGFDAVPIENDIARPGTPDVNYIDGWIELKKLPRWPARTDTIVRIEHFTVQQRVWLRRRWRKGGKAFLLVQVADELFLFDPMTAQCFLG